MMKLLLLLSLVPCLAFAQPTLVAHPEVLCEPGRTIAWTPAMQLAFDRLLGPKAKMNLERVEPQNELIDRMRGFKWDESKVLPQSGWFVVAGESGPKLANEATEKWRKIAGPDARAFELPEGAPGRSFAAIAGIKRDFEFSQAFSSARQSRLAWEDGVPVKFFGVTGERSGDFAENVRVLAYRPAEGVKALQFTAKKGDDTMILYTPREGQRMDEAILWVNSWKSSWKERQSSSLVWNDKSLHRSDDLRVPEIALDIEQNLTPDFAGNLYFKGKGEHWRVMLAKSDIKLSVDATGVKFESTAEIAGYAFSSMPEKPYPRRFWFDRPFFLFLWREGADLPYATVWFGNADALVK